MKIVQPLWLTRDGQYKVEVIGITGGKKFNLFGWDELAGKFGDWKPVIQVGSTIALSKYIKLTGIVRVEIPDFPPDLPGVPV